MCAKSLKIQRKYSIEWGWATWRTQWSRYDAKLTFWEKYKKSENFKSIFQNPKTYEYWKTIFERCYQRKLNSWAYKWLLCNMYHEKYSINPPYNLIENVGFTELATNTLLKNKYLVNKID